MLTIFAGPNPVTEQGWEVVEALQPDQLAVALNEPLDSKGQLSWKGLYPLSADDRVAEATRDAESRGIRTVAVLWMRPRRAYIDSCLDLLVRLVQCGAKFSSILLELEGSWALLGAQSSPYDDVTEYMFSRFRLIGLPLGVMGAGTIRPPTIRAATLADFVVAEAYSAWGKSAASRRQENSPGVLQLRAVESWSQYNDKVGLALPLFGLSRPSTVYSKRMTDDQSFSLQARAVPESASVYLWHLKHLTKLPPNRLRRFADLIQRQKWQRPSTSPTSTTQSGSS